ncbi:MAG: LysR family transcriptional regulator [Tropicimonas sp.]|uniref:LysR family transcriptional regulator n=1 Tax=Tropicimonas sp. TaxID=2067044 RepID=UPI003A8C7E24
MVIRRINSLRKFDHFLAASRLGNLHLAARELSLTQTAITKSIQNLEASLGARLFDRTAKGVSLTPFGRQFERRAARLMAHCDYLERELGEILDGTGGRLTIGAGTVWSSSLLPGILAGIRKERPTAEFVVLRSVGRRFQQQLVRREIDLGLGSLPQVSGRDGEFHYEELAEIRTCFFARAGHPLEGDAPVPLEELGRFPFAMFQLDDAIFDQIREDFLRDGLPIPDPSYVTESINSVMAFVAASDSITCLPAAFTRVAQGYGLVPLRAERAPHFKSGAIHTHEAAGYPLLETVLRALRHYSQAELGG